MTHFRYFAKQMLQWRGRLILAIALAIGCCSWALDNRYHFDTPVETHFLISFAILFIGLWIGYSSERSNNKK